MISFGLRKSIQSENIIIWERGSSITTLTSCDYVLAMADGAFMLPARLWIRRDCENMKGKANAVERVCMGPKGED